jgi:hypothetical protein
MTTGEARHDGWTVQIREVGPEKARKKDAGRKKPVGVTTSLPGSSTAVREPDRKDDDMADPKNAGTDGNRVKDPEDWTTGDEPATGAQESYLHTLATEADEEVPDGLTKAEASQRIDELQEKTGRGR